VTRRLAGGSARCLIRAGVLGTTAFVLGACALATDATADVADLRGTWRFTGEQTAPALTMTGSLVIESQSGDMVTGRLSWEEQAVGGGTRLDGGSVTGRVIGWTDVDFDVLLASGERRHVGRLSADTVRGAWVQLSTSASGEFVAVRETP
jgi:outer membrane biogenesis lipoprotein LolB